MNPGWRPLIVALLPRLLAIATVGALAGVALGSAWAWAVVAVGLLMVVIAQTRQLVILGRWLAAPDSAAFPDAGGIWGEVFLRLSRHLRNDAKAMREASQELSSFIEAIEALPEGIVLLDEHQQIVWCNRAAEGHLGIRPQRDRGSILGQLLRAPGFAEYLELADARQPFLLHSQGPRQRTHALTVVPFGHRRRIVASTDVTDARRVEAMRSDFVANVSHELRTPLTVVSGFLEHFTDDSPMDDKQRIHFARLMQDQTSRMLSLVDDLLTLSRLEADDAPGSEEAIDMNDMLEQMLELASGLSKGRHQVVAVAADGGKLRGNRRELQSAFANLVSNAIRYTPDGGRIEIAWRRVAGDADSAEAAHFCVRDSGVGIAAEHLPRLTERFYRVDRGRSRDSGGTGLGLAIVKHVLLRHQAWLDISSQPGEGSTFAAVFPGFRVSAGHRRDGSPARPGGSPARA